MIIEKLLSLFLSIPGLSSLSLSSDFISSASYALSSVGFVFNFIDVSTLIRNVLLIITVSLVAGIIKLLLSFVP